MSRYLLYLLLLFSFATNADDNIQAYVVGDPVEEITLNDQHDLGHTVDETTKLILFTTGMKGGKVVRKAIEDKEDDYLAKRKILFISNISGMPGFVARTFALPKMRKYGYSIMLDKEGNMTERFPSRKKNVTLIELDNLRIKSIRFTKKPDELEQAINQLPE